MSASTVAVSVKEVGEKSNDHTQLLDQLNQILSDLNSKGGAGASDIHQTISGLINDINSSFQNLDVLQKGSSLTTKQMVDTQLAMEQFTVTVTALSKLIGSVEKGISTLMHGQ